MKPHQWRRFIFKIMDCIGYSAFVYTIIFIILFEVLATLALVCYILYEMF